MTSNYAVYALAFACEPNRGSEPGVGYAFAEALAALSNEVEYDVILLTRPHRLEAVKAEILQSIGESRLKLVPISIPLWVVRLTGRRRVRWAYLVWQLRAVCHLRNELKRTKQRALIHHISFATEALPTFEWFLAGRAARIFGPAGSSQELNQANKPRLIGGVRRNIREYFGRLNLRDVDLAVANNSTVATTFERLGAREVQVEPNVVISSEQTRKAAARASRVGESPIDLISVGLLVELKRHYLAIQALAKIADQSVTLTVVGDGPLRKTLEQQAELLNVAHRVTFTGMVTRDEVLYLMSRARVLVHTSRQEGSAWVVGEAQAVGTVPVAFKGSGADSLITLTDTGVIAKSDSVEALVTAIETALTLSYSPSNRWDAERLPVLLGQWYDQLLTGKP